MSAIITEKFRQHNANQFHESFTEASASVYYLFIGKATSFTSGTTGGNDTVPPTPADDVSSEFYRWDSMIDDQYNFGFAVDLMVKDLEIVSKFSKKIGANISVTEMIKSYYKELQDMGAGKLDTSSLLKRLDEKDYN